MRRETKALPFEVAVACGYVPGHPQPWWRRLKNRIQLRLLPGYPPRVKVEHPKELTICTSLFQPVESHTVKMLPSAVLNHTLAEIDRVLNQTPEEVEAYWRKYRNEPQPKKEPISEDVAVEKLLALQARMSSPPSD